MKLTKGIFLLTLSTAVSFAAAPVITAIVNNYSYTPPNSPNYGIAQGSIFVIFGTNLSNITSVLQNAPLPTSISGVRVGLGADGEHDNLARLYYVSPTQIVGVLPSFWPVGTQFLWVTNNDQQSAPVPFKVVQSAFGVLTRDGTGSGPAAAFDATRNAPLSVSNSTKPGDIIQIYGTGVGPAGDDQPNNLTNIPTAAEVGGVSADILYRGRAIFPGLDQINLRIPPLPESAMGCNVPLVIKSGSISSNITTIPIATAGGTCPTPQSSSSTTMTAAEIERWTSAGTYTRGEVWLGYSFYNGGGDFAQAFFSRYSGSDLGRFLRNDANFRIPKDGQCSVGYANPYPNLTFTSLDLGPSILFSGPKRDYIANAGMDHTTKGYFTDSTGSPFFAAGRHTFSAQGGADGGNFSGALDVPNELVLTNSSELEQITRSSGATFRWQGGDPTQLVYISGTSDIYNDAANFVCYALGSAGQFTVPASVLNQLPPTSGPQVFGYISIGTQGAGVRLQAPGIDYLIANYSLTATIRNIFR